MNRDTTRLMHPENAFVVDLPHVRFGEFDFGGVLYHARYFHLYELAREEWLKAHDIPYSGLVAAGQHLPVAETRVQYIAPVYYDEPLTVYCWATDLRRVSAIMNYELIARTDSSLRLVNRAWTRHTLVQKIGSTFKVIPFSRELRGAMEAHLGTDPAVGI